MFNGIRAVDQVGPNVILEVVEGEFAGIKYYYEGMKVADKENADGTITMSFNYEIVEGTVPDDKTEAFHFLIGETLHKIVEAQVAKGEAIYKGGT
jgi:hypothetical protein